MEEKVAAMQGEIERKLGRCLLLLQTYELLMKKLAAECKVSGATDTLVSAQAKRTEYFSNKSLGQMVGELTGTFLVREDSALAQIQAEEDIPEMGDKDWLSHEYCVRMSPENFERINQELRRLVDYRNQLVHHFIERFDLGSETGCSDAEKYLDECYALVENHCNQWIERAENMRRTRALAASVDSALSSQFEDWLHGNLPNGQGVDWQLSTIVELLRDAEQACADDGWTSLNVATARIHESHPEQNPEKYGCRSWPHVLQESRLFKIEKRKSVDTAAKQHWYRSR